jgi:hypothetical protein
MIFNRAFQADFCISLTIAMLLIVRKLNSRDMAMRHYVKAAGNRNNLWIQTIVRIQTKKMNKVEK